MSADQSKNSVTEAKLICANTLLSNFADVNLANNEGDTPLTHASFYGYTQIVQLLLDNKSTIDKVGKRNWTPLMYASFSSNKKLETLELLVDYKADVNFTNGENTSPLTLATDNGNLEIVKILVSAGAKIDQKSALGYTSLHRAAKYNRHEVVDYMLKQPIAKFIINEQANSTDHTPLTCAVCFDGDLEMVKLLVSGGADTTIKGNQGKTPDEWAKEKDKNDILEYLNLLSDRNTL